MKSIIAALLAFIIFIMIDIIYVPTLKRRAVENDISIESSIQYNEEVEIALQDQRLSFINGSEGDYEEYIYFKNMGRK